MKLTRVLFFSLLSILAVQVFADDADVEAFKKALTDEGISMETIDILVKGKFSSIENFKEFRSYSELKDELKGMGIPVLEAVLLANKFGKEEPVKKERVDVSKMKLRELLNHVVANPSDKDALSELMGQTEVEDAEKRTSRWAVIVDKKLNVDLTLEYLNVLGKTQLGIKPANTFKGNRTKPIKMALGIENNVWCHPLFEDKVITDGLDVEVDLDWTTVPEKLRKTLLWARKTKHPLFPTNLDTSEGAKIHAAASTDPLTDVNLIKIHADYEAALKEGEPEVDLRHCLKKKQD